MPKRLLRALVAGVLITTPAVVGTTAAGAESQTVTGGRASAFGALLQLGGEDVIGPEPTVTDETADGDDPSATTIDIPADPLAVNGTLVASAALHKESDLDSALTVNAQELDGPYNAQGVGLIEDLQLLINEGTAVLSADVLRAEAVGVCASADAEPEYSANSEIVDLRIGGEPIPINDGVQQIIDGISTVLEESGLEAAVDVERNVVTELDDGGIAVDALVITLAEGQLATIRLGHAEVGGLECGADDKPECSDEIDNDGDGKIDFPNDPDCDSPEDDDESPECSDEIDNDGDGKIDFPNDPGCDDEMDDSELDDEGERTQLPTTGGTPGAATAIGAGVALAAAAALALRRRALT